IVPLSRATVREPADFSTEKCAGPQAEIQPPSTRSIRAVPDFTRTSLPLRRTVFTWPRTVSTRMGPLTAMDSPSMTPTASVPGSSERGRAAAKSAAPSIATAAAGSAARRRKRIELSKAVTSDTPGHCGRKSRLYYTSAVPQTHERMMITPKASADSGKESAEDAVNVHYDALPIIAAVVYSA